MRGEKRARKPKPTENEHIQQRWTQRPLTAQARWYTVHFDQRGEAWLVAETGESICLAEGMALDIVQLAWRGTVNFGEPLDREVEK